MVDDTLGKLIEQVTDRFAENREYEPTLTTEGSETSREREPLPSEAPRGYYDMTKLKAQEVIDLSSHYLATIMMPFFQSN